MKIFFTALFFTISIFCKGQSKTLVISEVYGGGGSSNATYKSDYIVLFNGSSFPINLSSYSVQVANPAGDSWSVTNLQGIIQPHHFYLVKGKGDGTAGADLPAADATGNFNFSTIAGKIGLVNSNNALATFCTPFNEEIMDFIGFGSAANCSETSYAPAHTNTLATSRINPGADADNNSTDFIIFSPNPKNTSALALPITLNSFSVSKIDKTNRVHWQVNCLSASVTFEVERSSSPGNFQTIYKATETKSRCAAPFDFDDKMPQNGSNYYRMKIINIDGDIFYSKIIYSVNPAGAAGLVKITPNIVSSQAEIHYVSGDNESIQLLVTDMQGRLVEKISSSVVTGANKIIIQAGKLSPGQYQVKLFAKNGSSINSARFIKE